LDALAAARRLSPREWNSRLQGDLDAIIAKAIVLDRQQRYGTVDRLAADIRRHQNHFPVTAVPPTRAYVAKCFLARNRLACLAGAAVLVAMVLATGISETSRIRERHARQAAERSEAKVAVFLNEAAARENATQAAILLSQNRTKEAEAMLQRYPISSIPPSAGAAYVFRFLGERYAVRGHWPEAAECYKRLMRSNRLSSLNQMAQGIDLLVAGPAVLEARDSDAYEEMRQDLLQRLKQVQDAVEAERIVKLCLLTPASRATLDKLRPMVALIRSKDGSANFSARDRQWFALATALFDLRDGNHSKAYDGAVRGLDLAITPSCRASLKLIVSMVAQSLGKSELARQEFDGASAMIKQAQPQVIVDNYEDYSPSSGYWHAWAVARILQREASALMAR
jgi:tetratricopeptide (TPR) repeat protein